MMVGIELHLVYALFIMIKKSSSPFIISYMISWLNEVEYNCLFCSWIILIDNITKLYFWGKRKSFIFHHRITHMYLQMFQSAYHLISTFGLLVPFEVNEHSSVINRIQMFSTTFPDMWMLSNLTIPTSLVFVRMK